MAAQIARDPASTVPDMCIANVFDVWLQLEDQQEIAVTMSREIPFCFQF